MTKPFKSTITNKLRTCVLTVMIAFFVQACASSSSTSTSAKTKAQPSSQPTYYIYLAGPEVFLPDPIGAGVKKKETIATLNTKHNWPFTLVGLYPMDNEIDNFAHDFRTGMAIYHANIELMDKADFITANMVRFRGPSMDVGTAFEMGYMSGLKKPVFAYYDAKPFYGEDETPGIYAERVTKYYPVSKDNPGVDIHGQSIENFQMADNLMMIGSLETGRGNIASSFEAAVLQIAESIKTNTTRK